MAVQDALMGAGGALGATQLFRWVWRTWKTDRRSDQVDAYADKVLVATVSRAEAAERLLADERKRADGYAEERNQAVQQVGALAAEVEHLRDETGRLENLLLDLANFVEYQSKVIAYFMDHGKLPDADLAGLPPPPLLGAMVAQVKARKARKGNSDAGTPDSPSA